MHYQLRIQGRHYTAIKNHLFPGDGKEAVAVLLCGRHEVEGLSVLLSHKIILIPHEECERDEQFVKWKTERLLPFFEEAEKKNFALVKMHSHPTGYPKFSRIDDESDSTFFPAAFSWSETESVHASTIMLPDGKIFGRVFFKNGSMRPLDKISVAGEGIKIWYDKEENYEPEAFEERNIQAFGEGTYRKLKKMKVGIVGASGTGSPTIEQLVRLGVGTIVLIDPDPIEDRNLNRIINSRKRDVGKKKVEVLKAAIEEMELGIKVIIYNCNLFESKEAIMELITCDVIFGCVDAVDARHLISQITNFYVIPYFDLGVRLKADGKGGITAIVGSVNYIQPGMSTLMSRGLYDDKKLAAQGMKRTSPEEYRALLERKYIDGVEVDRPAVISINMLISSISVIELLNRIHLFKDDEPGHYARMMIDYCGSCIENRHEETFDVDVASERWAGKGLCKPFLRLPELRF